MPYAPSTPWIKYLEPFSIPHNIEAPPPAKIGTNSGEISVAISCLFMYIKKILFVIK